MRYTKFVSMNVLQVASNNVNELKKQIDGLISQMDRKKAVSVQDTDIVDDEEYQLLAQLKKQKVMYRQQFDALREARSSMKPATQRVADAQRGILEAFEAWSAASGVGCEVC